MNTTHLLEVPAGLGQLLDLREERHPLARGGRCLRDVDAVATLHQVLLRLGVDEERGQLQRLVARRPQTEVPVAGSEGGEGNDALRHHVTRVGVRHNEAKEADIREHDL